MGGLLVMLLLVAVFTYVIHDVFFTDHESDVGPIDVTHSHPLPGKAQHH